MIEFLRTYSKSIGSAVTAGITAYVGVAAGGVTGPEFWLIVGAILAGAGITWGLPFNLGPGSVFGAPPVRRVGRRVNEAGTVTLHPVLTVVLIVLGVLAILWLGADLLDVDLDDKGR